jgi:hypothetical protein
MLRPSCDRCLLVPSLKPSAMFACVALLCWLLSVLGGVHAHTGGKTDHDHGDSNSHSNHSSDRGNDHGNIHALHSALDGSHEAHHAESLEVDAGVDPLLSVVNAGKVIELPLLSAAALLLVLLSLQSGLSLPALPRKPPRHTCLLRPPLRAPPVVPA